MQKKIKRHWRIKMKTVFLKDSEQLLISLFVKLMLHFPGYLLPKKSVNNQELRKF